jgi:hypothetical protein
MFHRVVRRWVKIIGAMITLRLPGEEPTEHG